MIDPITITAAISAASAGINLINKMYDKVYPFITGSHPMKKEHRLMIEGKGDRIVAKEYGGVKIITGDDLKNLPSDMLDHIQVYEKAAQNKYEIWKNVYPQRNASTDPIVNAKVDQQLRKIVVDMKNDLDGILRFLEESGIKLTDHYTMFRDAIQQSGSG
jgi:hypothetical protein